MSSDSPPPSEDGSSQTDSGSSSSESSNENDTSGPSSRTDPLSQHRSGVSHDKIKADLYFDWQSPDDNELSIEHIRGFPSIRERVKQLILDPATEKQEHYERFNVGPSSLLLEGKQGTGKTHAVECVLGSLDTAYVTLSPQEVMSHYINRSGKLITQLFHEAEVNAEALGNAAIFIDEIDAVLPSRDSNTKLHQESRKIVNQFLKELETASERSIIFIGATNRPDALDPAATRQGRIDETITFSEPGAQGRFEILKYHLGDRPHHLTLEEIRSFAAQHLDGYTPAEIKAFADAAARAAAYEEANVITLDHLREQA